MKTIQLTRDGQHFIFRYESGQESVAMEHLIAMVKDGRLDWFDAACLSHQIGRGMTDEIREMTEKIIQNPPTQG